MNWFIDLNDCCGCGACEQSCPTGCIFMSENQEGFLMPQKDIDHCIDCGVCQKVCPVLNKQALTISDRMCFSCRTTNNDILEKSSSGGIFTHLSEKIIEQGGVVYGVAFDNNWETKVVFADNKEDIHLLRGSKYVNAAVGHAYQDVLRHIQNGKMVLFSGTPCQVSGLNRYLQCKKYDNLITIDIMCHGVPSPKVWRKYLYEVAKGNDVHNISFRSKAFGWNRYALLIEDGNGILLHEPNINNVFMRGFLNNLYNRNSCSNCPARGFSSGSDLTIGDYWEIEQDNPEFDNRGVSLVTVNTPKGMSLLEKVRADLSIQKVDFSSILKSNCHSTLLNSAPIHPNRKYFFSHLDKTDNVSSLIEKCLCSNVSTKNIRHTIRNIYRKLRCK